MQYPSRRALVLSLTFFFGVTCGLLLPRLSDSRSSSATVEWSVDPFVEGTVIDRITLRFDREVAPAVVRSESAGTTEDGAAESAAFRLQPEVAGRWEWVGHDRLDFLPTDPLPRGRRFLITPIDPSLEVGGHRLADPGPREIESGALTLRAVALESADEGEAVIRFRFDQAVSPRLLLEHVRVSHGGSPLELRLLDGASGERVDLAVSLGRGSGALVVEVDGGLSAVEGELPLAEKVVRRLTLPERFTVLAAETDSWLTWEEPTVSIRFSAAPEERLRPGFFTVEPPVEGLRVVRSGRGASSRVQLSGGFRPGAGYSIEVSGEIHSARGERLDAARTLSVTMPDRRPGLSFPISRGILAPTGNLALRLRATNVDGVDLSVWRVHESNLAAHLLGRRLEETSRALGTRTISLDSAPNEVGEHRLDLAALLGEGARGIYTVRARAKAPRWVNDRAVVSISDLGIRARLAAREALVWVNSIAGGAGIPDAEVRIVTRSDQTIARGRTDSRGVARIELPVSRPDGEPFVAVVTTPEDTGFLRLTGSEDSIRGVDLTGAEWPESYEVAVAFERGVARPGERVRLSGLLRDASGGTPPPLPIELHWLRPDGREISRAVVTPAPDGDGSFEHAVETRADAPTGVHELTVTLPGGGAVLGRAELLVEQFLPVRVEVAAEMTPGEAETASRIEARARTLHGGSIEGSALRLTTRFSPREFRSERFPLHSFETEDAGGETTTTAGPFPLDEGGLWSSSLAIPPGVGAAGGLWDVRATVSVTEPGSRTVSASAAGLHDASGRHLGLRLADGPSRPGEEREARVLLLDGDENPLEGAVRWELLREERSWELRETASGPRWLSETEEIEVEAGGQTLTAEGESSIRFTCPTVGWYRLRAWEEGRVRTTLLRFPAFEGVTPPAERERAEQLALALPSGPFAPGSPIEVRIAAPFGGRLLWTLETDRIVSEGVVESIAAEGAFPVRLPENARGSLFLSATIIRPVEPSDRDWRPHRAYGLARIPLETDGQRLALSIGAEGEGAAVTPLPPIEPRATQEVVIRTPAPAPGEVAGVVRLWGVDRGIVLASGFEPPDPFDTFLAPRRAAVRGIDNLGDLLPDDAPAEEMVFIGGDRRRARRTQPVDLVRRSGAVVWAGVRPVEADGRARFEVELPDLLGELEWFAIASRGDRYGATSEVQLLRTPILVESPWPRFVAPGDTFTATVRLTNSTDEDLAVRPVISVDGPLEVTTPRLPEGLRLPKGETRSVSIEARATAPGPVSIVTEAVPLGDDGGIGSCRVVGELLVRPVQAFMRSASIARSAAGSSLDRPAPVGFDPGTTITTVRVDPSARVELAPAVGALLDYPFGCAEQTSSRLFAIATALDPRVGFNDSAAREGLLRDWAAGGLRRLRGMQNRDGGLGAWRGSSSSPWISTYALDAIDAMRSEGVEVPSELEEGLRQFVRASLGASGATLSPDTRVRILRHLAGDALPPRARLLRWSEESARLSLAGLVDLAAAWERIGEAESARSLVAEALARTEPMATPPGAVVTEVAARARLLELVARLDPRDPAISALRDTLVGARREGRWGSTYENARAIRALARLGADEESPSFTGLLEVGERSIRFSSEEAAELTVSGAAPVRVRTEGKGSFSLVTRTEGLSVTLPEPFEQGLQVTRRWARPSGEPIEVGSPLAVGDLVVVTIEARTGKGRGEIPDIAVVDALPGGLEPENPRLVSSAGATVRGGDVPESIEFLDDRIVIFDRLGEEVRTWRYALRATTPGVFAVPPLEASSMYDPSIGALTAGGTLTVESGR